MSPLYSLDINSLPHTWFAYLFSHSVGCLFILSMGPVGFVVHSSSLACSVLLPGTYQKKFFFFHSLASCTSDSGSFCAQSGEIHCCAPNLLDQTSACWGNRTPISSINTKLLLIENLSLVSEFWCWLIQQRQDHFASLNSLNVANAVNYFRAFLCFFLWGGKTYIIKNWNLS